MHGARPGLRSLIILILAAAVLTTACGSGGGGSAPAPAAAAEATVAAAQGNSGPAAVPDAAPPAHVPESGGGDSIAVNATAGPARDEPTATDAHVTAVPGPADNSAPVISGTPAPSVVAGERFSFTPAAVDQDDDALEFAIRNAPAWARFDPATGQLEGTPGPGDVGTYERIEISLTDGLASSALAPFTITVEAVGSGRVTVSWTAPTQNTDGSALEDLAGYRVLYGRSRNHLDQTIELDQPGITTVVVEDLGRGTWNFAVRAVNSAERESDLSAIVVKNLP